MKQFNRIILPVDGSDLSKKAAEKAFEIAKNLSLDIYSIYVIDMNIYTNMVSKDQIATQWESILKNEGKAIFKELGEIADLENINLTTKILEGNPADEILKISDENDLIIMGSKGKNALDRVLVGSVSENVLHHSDASVMIIR